MVVSTKVTYNNGDQETLTEMLIVKEKLHHQNQTMQTNVQNIQHKQWDDDELEYMEVLDPNPYPSRTKTL